VLTQLEQALQAWQESSLEAGLTRELPLSIVREHWLNQIDEQTLSQRFMAGAVNFATLMPMRAIPFQRVCLLGMNDGDYPRSHPPIDFDLMNGDYRPGDRSRREDDRYLFLEALLSARQQFYVSWVGRSIVDNSEKPPSVLVGQLRDHLATGWRTDGDADLLDALTTFHPLQPFSRAYFPSAEAYAARDVAARRLVTYAHEWRAVHHSEITDNARLANTMDTTAALPPFVQETPLTLHQLGSFLRNPAKAFFNTRLKVYLEREDIVSHDQEPFALDGLEKWQLQDLLIQAQRQAVDSGHSRETALSDMLDCLQGQGVLAMGAFGERMRESLAEPMQALFDDYQQALEEWPYAFDEPLPIRLATPGGPLLEDWLGDLRHDDDGNRCRLLLISSSLIRQGDRGGEYQWRHLLRPWVAHLAGHLDDTPMTTRLLSKAGNITLSPLDPAVARRYLRDLIDAWQTGMQSPLPLASDTAFAWLSKDGSSTSTQDSDAWKVAAKAYEGTYKIAGEIERDPYLAHRWVNFAALYQAHLGTPYAFATLSERLLAPVYQAVKGGKS
ncbi:MAG: exodeoxyribonuclease V subunit gamma, partial [Halomonas sp.]|nr:exodeoxyribonuclease V subunit gamma [Halomonas sp.]